MATNDFVPFCSVDTGTNLEEQAAYLADPQLLIGNQPGVARSQLVNKALRQSTYIAACLAQFLANTTGNNVLDDATMSEVLATLAAAFQPTSEIIVNTQSGYGSTGTKVITYTTVEQNIGSNLSYTSDAVNGDKITVNAAGLYCVSACVQPSASSSLGVSKNASSTSTSIQSLATAQILMIEGSISGQELEMSVTQRFAQGDILRVQGDGTTLVGSAAFTRFRVTQVSI
jgi:hypothetical protein